MTITRKGPGITIASEDALWFGQRLYCKTPEALEVALATLRDIGYIVDDKKADGEEHERTSWYAHLDVDRIRCKSCKQFIEQRGVAATGHVCELCGEITYIELGAGSIVSIEFAQHEDERGMFSPEITLEVASWDYENGLLYLESEPLQGNRFSSVTGEKAQAYLAKHASEWQYVELEGHKVIQLQYWPSHKRYADEQFKNLISVGHNGPPLRRNYSEVKVWEGKEYEGPFGRLPIPDSITVYETWHWAPRATDHELYKYVISAGGQRSDASWYRSTDPTWNRPTFERMGEYIRHFTTLDADRWFALVKDGSMPTVPARAIEAIRLFCAGEDISLSQRARRG